MVKVWAENRRSFLVMLAAGILFLLLLAALVFVWWRGGRRQPVATVQSGMVYVVDVSSRMALPFKGGSGARLAAAQNFVAELARANPAVYVEGLRVFSSGAAAEPCDDTTMLVPFAANNEPQIRQRLLNLNTGPAEAGLFAAIAAAIRDLRLLDLEGPKRLILVTGGDDTCGGERRQLLDEELRRAQIELETFIIDMDDSQQSAVALKGVVEELGGGVYVEAGDQESLDTARVSLQTYFTEPETITIGEVGEVIAAAPAIAPTDTAMAVPLATETAPVTEPQPAATDSPVPTPVVGAPLVASPTPTSDLSPTPTLTRQGTFTPTPSATASGTPTTTATATGSPMATGTASGTPTATTMASATPTPTATPPTTPTHTATATVSPTATPSATPTRTPTPTSMPTLTATTTPAAAPTNTPTAPPNRPPSFSSEPPLSALLHRQYVYQIVATDPDPGDSVTITAPVRPGWLTLSDNGDGTATLSGTPGYTDVRRHDVALEARDAAGATAVQIFTIEVGAAAPSLPVSFDGITIHSVGVAGQDRVARVSPGSTVTVDVTFFIQDTACPSCVDQILIGIADDATINEGKGCVYSGVPGPEGVSGSGSVSFSVPTAAGAYALRFRLGQDFFCNLGWWHVNFTPGQQRDVAYVIVSQ